MPPSEMRLFSIPITHSSWFRRKLCIVRLVSHARPFSSFPQTTALFVVPGAENLIVLRDRTVSWNTSLLRETVVTVLQHTVAVVQTSPQGIPLEFWNTDRFRESSPHILGIWCKVQLFVAGFLMHIYYLVHIAILCRISWSSYRSNSAIMDGNWTRF